MSTRQDMIDQGYIRVQVHPDNDQWKIYNYTEKAAWERVWNEHTLECRGLIEAHGEVIARPFPKFFNYGEPNAPEIGMSEVVDVYDKADGSLGILYEAPDGLPAIATRGSFASEQAVWATKHLREVLAEEGGLESIKHFEFTQLYEIVYPENRIVLDYGDWSGLILLGLVDKSTGEFIGPSREIKLPNGVRGVETLGRMTFEEALKLPDRPHREGVVIRTLDGRTVKVKQDDYVALHRIVSNITPKNTWERVKQLGGGFFDPLPEGLFEDIPNEFHEEITRHALGIHEEIYIRAEQADQTFCLEIPQGLTRKEFAQYAVKYSYSSYLFLLYDDRVEDMFEAIERKVMS